MPSTPKHLMYRAGLGLPAALVTAMLLLAVLSLPVAADNHPKLAKKIKAPTVAQAQSRHAARPAADAGRDLLVYHGGPVLTQPAIYLSFWGPEWAASSYRPAIKYVEGFLSKLGGSPWLGLNSEYCSGNLPSAATSCTGSNFQRIQNPAGQLKGVWIDSAPVIYTSPSSRCSATIQMAAGDCDVILAAGRAANHFGALPPGAVIAVMTPSGLSQPGFTTEGWCAYHWSVPQGGAVSAGGTPYEYVPFAPDAGGSCGKNDVNSGPAGIYDGLSILTGHEYAEAITDPFPTSGWIDGSGQENADKCIWVSDANITLGGQQYAVQSNWSNAAGGCVLAPPPVPGQTPTFESLGGALTSGADAASWGADRLDVFARSPDNALSHIWWDGRAWSGWEGLGGVLNSDPAAIAWGPNRLDVFARGSDGALWHKWWDGSSWSGWESLGGILSSAPDAASWSAGRLDVVVAGTDRGLWHRWWDGGWSGWESLGGVVSADPGAASGGPDHLDIFVRGTDNGLWQKSWATGWSGWQPLGGSLSSGPDVASPRPGVVSVFALGANGSLFELNYNRGWAPWLLIGGQWSSGPSAVSRGSAIEIFERGRDNALWHASVASSVAAQRPAR